MRGSGSFATAAFVAAALAPSDGAALSTQPPLADRNFILGPNVVNRANDVMDTRSEVVCAPLGTRDRGKYTCEFSWNMHYQSIDPRFQVFTATWDGVSKGGLGLSGEFGFDIGVFSRTWTAEVPNMTETGAVAPPGAPPTRDAPLRYSNLLGANIDGSALLYATGATPGEVETWTDTARNASQTLKSAFGFKHKITENPDLATFLTEVVQTEPGVFEYGYVATNLTAAPLSFDWQDAGWADQVGPGETRERRFTSGLAPSVYWGSLSAVVTGGAISGPLATVVPGAAPGGAAVPLPPAAALLGAAVCALAAGRRRRRAAQG